MPDHLSPAQIRGARGLLDGNRLDLSAAARLSVSTIERGESGLPQAVSEAVDGLIRDALETEGLRFLADDGGGPEMRLRRKRWRSAADASALRRCLGKARHQALATDASARHARES